MEFRGQYSSQGAGGNLISIIDPAGLATGDGNEENQDPDKCTDCPTGSTTGVNTGKLTADHVLASHRSLGQSRAVRLVYNSTAADPRPILTSNATIAVLSAVPQTMSTRLEVAGVDQGAELFTATTGLDENLDETLRQAVQFDAAGFDTGLYPFRLMLTNNYPLSSVSSTVLGTVLVNNEAASRFGAGWTLDGLARLHLAGVSPVLTSGGGGVMRFTPQAGGLFGPPADFGAIADPLAHAVADLDGDGDLDLAVPDTTTGKVFVLLNDGAGGFVPAGSVQAGAPAPGVPDTVSVATGDFNEDLVPDIAVAAVTAEQVSVLLKTGGTRESGSRVIPMSE